MDAFDSYEASLNPLVLSTHPMTLVMPFKDFGFRGGGAGLPDFSKLRAFYFTFRVFQGGELEDLGFYMELDRIRIGRIPEPASEALMILGLAVAGRMRSAGRRSV